MPDSVSWIVAAAVLVVGEVLTRGYILGPVALAALVAAAAAAAGAGIAVQLVVFVAASLASLALVRRWQPPAER
jgi:membrane protein implicated in regulation of membrane protease activity